MSQSTKPVEGELHLKARSALCAIEKKRGQVTSREKYQ